MNTVWKDGGQLIIFSNKNINNFIEDMLHGRYCSESFKYRTSFISSKQPYEFSINIIDILELRKLRPAVEVSDSQGQAASKDLSCVLSGVGLTNLAAI